MHDPGRLDELFNKYLERRCSSGELEELVALLHEAGAENALEGKLREVWDQLKYDRTKHDVDWDKMYKTISSVEEPDVAHLTRKQRSGWKWVSIAAFIILVLSMSAYWLLTHNSVRPVAPKQDVAGKAQKTNSVRQTIHLADGSTVILNANSKLNYPAEFTGKTREVYLTGEGYFDIKHKLLQPFLVHTGKLVTRVIGTSFNIKAYSTEKFIEVTVTRGKVQVLNESKSLAFINPGQQVSFNNNTEEYSQKTVDVQPVISWKPGEIFFNDITMEEAARQLESRFNLEITFSNPVIKNCRVTATFSEDDLPDEILTVICAVTRANYSVTDKKILISGKGCD